PDPRQIDYKPVYETWRGMPPGPKYEARKALALESFYHILYELVEMPSGSANVPQPLATILETLVRYQSIIQDPQPAVPTVDANVRTLREKLRQQMVQALRDKLMVAAP